MREDQDVKADETGHEFDMLKHHTAIDRLGVRHVQPDQAKLQCRWSTCVHMQILSRDKH